MRKGLANPLSHLDIWIMVNTICYCIPKKCDLEYQVPEIASGGAGARAPSSGRGASRAEMLATLAAMNGNIHTITDIYTEAAKEIILSQIHARQQTTHIDSMRTPE